MNENPHAPKLTVKQAAFCAEYLIDLNATQAAIRAGYSEKTARSQAQRMLTNVDIGNELARLMKEREERTAIKADTVLSELLKLARVDIGDAFDEAGNLKPMKDMPEDLRRAMSGVEVFEEFAGRGEERTQIGFTKKVRFWDKTRALELLGRHLRLFSDKLEVTGKDGGPLLVQDTRPTGDSVAEFSAALFRGYRDYTDERTGGRAELDPQAIASLSSIVAEFAAGSDGDAGPMPPAEIGHRFARTWLIRENLRLQNSTPSTPQDHGRRQED